MHASILPAERNEQEQQPGIALEKGHGGLMQCRRVEVHLNLDTLDRLRLGRPLQSLDWWSLLHTPVPVSISLPLVKSMCLWPSLVKIATTETPEIIMTTFSFSFPLDATLASIFSLGDIGISGRGKNRLATHTGYPCPER